jgi:hypothetical protein
MHQVSAEVVAAANLRKQNAMHVQQMMVAILTARFMAERLGANDAECPDRGSEMGECVDLLSDNEPNSVSDTEDEASDAEDLHGHVNTNSLDDGLTCSVPP